MVPDARGDEVRVLPVPGEVDVLGPLGRLATTVTGVLLAVAVVSVLAGTSLRRIAARRGDPVAADRYAPPTAPSNRYPTTC